MKIIVTLGIAAAGALGLGPVLGTSGHVPFMQSGYQPPAQCVAWYDGCNMCSKENGKLVCTHRSCSSAGKGFCKAYMNTPQNG